MLCFGVTFVYTANYEPENTTIPKFGFVPNFTFDERSGGVVTKDDLYGEVWIADFIFSNCGGGCPSMSENMLKLQAEFANTPKIRLVSFTVDPDRDSVESLSEYANAYGAKKEKWLFLTGKKKFMYSLIQKGFRLPVDPNLGTDDEPILHSIYFVLVDKRGYLRGYYDSSNEKELVKLVTDARTLLQKNKIFIKNYSFGKV